MELTRERSERAAAEATSLARGFLDRWRDPLTRAARDDCAQEAVLRAVQRLPGMRDPARFPALVRTIARRMRYRELLDQRRMRSSRAALRAKPRASLRGDHGDGYLVAGRLVEKRWLLAELAVALERLCPLSRGLLRGYYEGFSCRELAERYGLEEECVKVRLHRGRRKIRVELEGRACAAWDW
jgi:RNA polymerase sigma factor (sigma-70 family)